MSFLNSESFDRGALIAKPAFRLLHQSPGAFIVLGEDSNSWAKSTGLELKRALRIKNENQLPSVATKKSGHVLWLYLGQNIDAERTLSHFEPLLKYSRIDVVQSAGLLSDVSCALLQQYGYSAYTMQETGWAVVAESPSTADFFAHSRLDRLLRGLKPKMPDLAALLGPMSGPRGAIHVGAYNGSEVPVYIEAGRAPIVLVEANPDLAAQLRERFNDEPRVIVEHCAASDADGTITLNITSSDQSSSILPLKLHKRYYPRIVVEREVEVFSKRLDRILEEHGLHPAQFGFINLDIQGAELKALQGAHEILRHVGYVYVEVNFTQLYEGCPEIEDLDDFLATYGFKRVLTSCPWHPTWGDAFYVKD